MVGCNVRFCGCVICRVKCLVGVFFRSVNFIIKFEYSEWFRFVESDLMFDMVVESGEISFCVLCKIIFVIMSWLFENYEDIKFK